MKPVLTLFLISVTSLYTLQKYAKRQGPYIFLKKWNDSISCHHATEGDALPPAEGLLPLEDSIFFHETSCRGGLDSRQACALESVARNHPERPVCVFFNSPVSEVVLRRSCLARLTQFRNVNIARLNTAEYAKGTPLGEFVAHENNKNRWRRELTSDKLLRYITMYKYGGVYLDADVLVVRPLDSLGEDWVVLKNNKTVYAAILSFSKQGLGHELVTQILKKLRSNYRFNQRQDGHKIMTEVLFELCKVNSTVDMNELNCRGFIVHKPELFYPIKWNRGYDYFKFGKQLRYNKKVFTHHLWNKKTQYTPFQAASFFDQLASKHCPTVREMYGDKFGMSEILLVNL